MTPVVFLFAALVLLGTRSFEEAQAGPFSPENINRLVGLGGALFFAIGALAVKGSLNIPAPLRWFAAYIIVCLVSAVLYSEWVLYSLWKVIELVAAVTVSMYIATVARKQPQVAFMYYEYCILFFLILVALSVLGIAVHGDGAFRATLEEASVEAYGDAVLPYQLRGTLAIVNPNSLGGMSGILVYVYLLRILNNRSKVFYYVLFALCAFVFVLSQSRTAWIGLLVALAWYLIFSQNSSKRNRLYLGLFVAGGLAASLNLLISYLTRGYSAERLQNLSGRAAWWEAAWSKFWSSTLDEQIFGMGFMTGNRKITQEEFGYTVSSLHSDYADALISTGYLGLTCIILFVGSTWLLMLPIGRRRGCLNAEFFGITIMLTIRSFMGTTLAIFNFFMVIAFSIIVASSIIVRIRED